jgi:hypothetical protein
VKRITDEMEKGRVKIGPLASSSEYGHNGVFRMIGPRGVPLICIISDQGGWEHVSVERDSLKESSQKVPYWDEMCFVKDFFWDDDEVVVQYHPKKDEYVNFHRAVLHLWKPVYQDIPTPPVIFV